MAAADPGAAALPEEETLRDFWRYGIDANRKELELVMRYTHEQGMVKHQRKFEELFHTSTFGLGET
jgi:hypothetical protein